MEFIWHSVAALRSALVRHGGSLHVLHGLARQRIPAIAARLGAEAVFAARDHEPAAVARDAAVGAQLAASGRMLHLVKDQVIFDSHEVLTAAGAPYHVFTPYKRAWLARLNDFYLSGYSAETYYKRLAPASSRPTGEGEMPTQAALGFQPTSLAELTITPGEAGAQAAFTNFKQRIERYRDARDFPAADGTSHLSVHLRFGTVSIRELARFAYLHGGPGAETWLSELIWRDFYQMLLDRYPHTTERPFQSKYDSLAWPNPPGHFQAWCEARTGYPIVDAGLRQLNRTGDMHNRLRMIAASFLVKDLHVDWRLGERYFAAKLNDYDQAANVGGWQWSAGVGSDAQPWFRIFNPVTQSEKFDPAGNFIRRYLPELAAVPDRFIHAPWTLTPAQQSACGLRIGRDYPAPLVDHARARTAALALYRTAPGKATAL